MSKFNDDFDWKPLIAAVVINAVKDAQGKNAARALDAVVFLTGEDAPLYLDVLEIWHENAIDLVINGGAKKAKVGKNGQ